MKPAFFILSLPIVFLYMSLIAEDPTATTNTAVVPVTKLENDSYDWEARHADVLRIKDTVNPEVVLIGDSITHFWGGAPKSNHSNGPTAWLTRGMKIKSVDPKGSDRWEHSIKLLE